LQTQNSQLFDSYSAALDSSFDLRGRGLSVWMKGTDLKVLELRLRLARLFASFSRFCSGFDCKHKVYRKHMHVRLSIKSCFPSMAVQSCFHKSICP